MILVDFHWQLPKYILRHQGTVSTVTYWMKWHGVKRCSCVTWLCGSVAGVCSNHPISIPGSNSWPDSIHGKNDPMSSHVTSIHPIHPRSFLTQGTHSINHAAWIAPSSRIAPRISSIISLCDTMHGGQLPTSPSDQNELGVILGKFSTNSSRNLGLQKPYLVILFLYLVICLSPLRKKCNPPWFHDRSPFPTQTLWKQVLAILIKPSEYPQWRNHNESLE